MNTAQNRLQILEDHCWINKLKRHFSEIRNQKSSFRARSAGFTVIEILIAVTILGTLIGGVLLTINPVKQINKSRDAQRRSDLQEIRTAVDIFYSDKECYPQEIPFGYEWKEGLTLYMKEVPQDFTCQGGTGACYRYRTDAGSSCPQWNVIFAKLSDDSTIENACPLARLSACTPPGYEEGKWACTMSGSVDCGALASAASLIGGEETYRPAATVVPVTPTLGPTATPVPTTAPIPGSVTYSIGNSANTNPDIYEVTMMPLWQTVGEAQQVSVKIDDTAGTISPDVELILYSDNEARKFTLTRTGGTPTSGTWTGTWEVTDTYAIQYGIDITARDSAGNVSTERLIFR